MPTPSDSTSPAFPVGDRFGGDDGDSGNLAFTGSESTVPLTIGGLALLAGIGLLVSAVIRRRRALSSED